MTMVEVDVEQQYEKRFREKRDEKTLEFIFSQGLFPRRLYYPAGASISGGYLSILFGDVWRVSLLQRVGNVSLQKLVQYSFGTDLLIKHQEHILREKGRIIITDCGPHAFAGVEKLLAELYPGKKLHYAAFDALKLKGKAYKILLRVGFFPTRRYRVRNNLPQMDHIGTPEEKTLIFPVIEDVLHHLCFQRLFFCCN